MKKADLTGCRYVFSFTLVQTLKSKAYRITLAILLVIAVLSFPVISLVTEGMLGDSEEISSINKLYVFNETAFESLKFNEITEAESFSEIEVVYPDEDYETVVGRIKSDEGNSVLIRVYEENGAYYTEVKYSQEGEVSSTECSVLGQLAAEILQNYKINELKLSDEQTDIIFSEVSTRLTVAGINEESGEPVIIQREDTSISNDEFWFVYVVLFVVLMVNVIANSSIASAIVEDKASRVVEYLLTSIRPMAIIMGKILAMLIAVLLQMGVLAAAALISSKLSGTLMGGESQSLVSSYISNSMFENINPLNFIISLVVIALGMIFYAALAGIAGAMASRPEELSDTLSLFTIINLVGAYIAMGAANVLNVQGENAFSVFALICPVSSPFLLPGAIFIGKVSVPVAIAAILLLIISNFLIFSLVAKVYESLILHMGNSLKLKDLRKIIKNTSGRTEKGGE